MSSAFTSWLTGAFDYIHVVCIFMDPDQNTNHWLLPFVGFKETFVSNAVRKEHVMGLII